MVVSGTERQQRYLAQAFSSHASWPSLRRSSALHVLDRIGSTAPERYDVVFPVAWTGTGRQPGRRAGVLTLKLVRDRTRSVLACCCAGRHGQRDDRDEPSETGWNSRPMVNDPHPGYDKSIQTSRRKGHQPRRSTPMLAEIGSLATAE